MPITAQANTAPKPTVHGDSTAMDHAATTVALLPNSTTQNQQQCLQLKFVKQKDSCKRNESERTLLILKSKFSVNLMIANVSFDDLIEERSPYRIVFARVSKMPPFRIAY